MYHYMGDLDCKVVEMEMIMRERVEMILCVGALNDFLVRNRLNTKKSRQRYLHLRTLPFHFFCSSRYATTPGMPT